MSRETLAFVGAWTVGMLIFLTILVFRHLLEKGRQIRRSIFVTSVTVLGAIGGLTMGLAFDAGQGMAIASPFYMAATGLIAALGVSVILYRRK